MLNRSLSLSKYFPLGIFKMCCGFAARVGVNCNCSQDGNEKTKTS